MWESSLNKTTRLILVLIIAFVSVGLDQYTKKLAIERYQSYKTYQPDRDDTFYFNNFVRITYAENPGAFLSLGDSLPDGQRFWILTGLNAGILFVVALVLFFRRQLYYPVVIALSLIICGGVGNLIDRIFRDGYVVDFLVLGLQDRNIPFKTGIFNVADFLIMVGIGLLIFTEFFAPRAAVYDQEVVPIESHKGKDQR